MKTVPLLKIYWPAIIATLVIGSVIWVAAISVIHHWSYIQTTLLK